MDSSTDVYEVLTRIRDLDILGHVWQGAYHEYIEESRARILRLDRGQIGYPFVLAHVEIDHRSELRHTDESVTVRAGIERIGERSVGLIHQVNGPDGRLCAAARSTMVAFDQRTGASRPITEAEREAYAPRLIEGGAGPTARVDLADPVGPALTRDLDLRWRDLNPGAHVDQGRVHEFLDEARALVLGRWFDERSAAFVLGRQEIDYLSEIRLSDGRLRIISGVETVGARKVILGHRITRADGAPLVRARSVMVAFDRETRASRPLTPDDLARLTARE